MIVTEELKSARETRSTETDEIHKGDLLARGWTEGAIKRFLPPPEVEERHRFRGGYYVVYLYDPQAVEQAERDPVVQKYLAKVRARRERRLARVPEHIPLIDAIREASRAAHRWRDAAQTQYRAENHGLAGHAKREKERLYSLKERGIAAAFKQGLLRYAGVSPQGMGVYEYDKGGKSCFHSCIHPAGTERRPVDGHPEILEVKAKHQSYTMADTEFTLSELPEPGLEFERTAPPQKPREQRTVVWFECGEEGHIARNCPEREELDEDDDWNYISQLEMLQQQKVTKVAISETQKANDGRVCKVDDTGTHIESRWP